MESEAPNKRLKIEPLLGGLALMLLLIGCFFVLKPFMTALMWAMILAYSLHPLQRVFTRWFRGSRTLAACFVTLIVTLTLAGPIVLVGFSIAQDGKDLAKATQKWFMSAPSVAPPWVAKVPFVGADVTAYWSKYTEDGKRMLNQLEKEVKVPPRPKIVIEGEDGAILQEPPPIPEDAPLEGKKTDETTVASEGVVAIFGKFLTWAWGWLLSITLAVGSGVTQLLLSGFLAFFLLRDAPILSDRLAIAADRLAGSRGLYLVKVAGDTVRGVIYGIIGTAIAQALLAGLGFWFAGVPGAVLLGVVTFFFGVVPFGPPLVWLPASLWLFAQGHSGMGIFMLIWGAFVISGIDNVLKPYLISQGSKMPFVLIFCGVIGGAFAFGLVGVFLGPTLLAVAFRVIEEWSSHRAEPDAELPVKGSSVLIKEVASDTQLHGGESLGIR